MPKPRILFVGAFRPGPDGARGGQMIACTTLLNSSLSASVEWVLIDSTASTNHHRSFLQRLIGAALRMIKFLYYLIFGRIDTVLLFCSGGYSFREKGLMAIWAKKMGKRVVLAPRSGLIINDIEGSDQFRKTVTKVLNHVDVLVCQGPSWRSFYQKISENKQLAFEVVHNWIDLQEVDQNVAPIKKRSSFNVVFLGWITQNKGVFDILSAAEKLRSLPINFILGGHGDAFEELNTLAEKKQLDQLTLLGWVTGQAKTDLLNKADIFILPSYREGYPNSVIEAMAYGIPVIASNVGSIPDLIENGINGLLTSPGQPDELADNIELLHNDRQLMHRIGIAARKRVTTNNALQIAVQKMNRILSVNAS